MRSFTSCWWLALSAAPAALPVLATTCTADDQCIEGACRSIVTASHPCELTTCSAAYARCVCSGSSALRTDGGCDEEVVDQETCGTTHHALFALTMRGGPELNAGHPADEGTPMVNMLRRSLAAAVRQPPQDVTISDVHVSVNEGALEETPGDGDLVAFDWNFRFCIPNIAMEINPHDFEHRFIVQAQHYVAFHKSTLRLLQLDEANLTRTNTEQPRDHKWLWRLCAALVMLCTLIAWGGFQARKRCLQTSLREALNAVQAVDDDDLEEAVVRSPDGDRLRWLEGCQSPGGRIRRAHARVIQCTEPQEGILELAEGDVIEVLAAGGVWTYGHKLGHPQTLGFFPESCVAWLGRPMPFNLQQSLGEAAQPAEQPQDWSHPNSPTNSDEGAATGAAAPAAQGRGSSTGAAARATPARRPSAADRPEASPPLSGSPPAQPPPADGRAADGPRVRITWPFAPEEVNEDELRQCCLTLERGEIVEVLAAGGGWYYGRLRGKEGYFPEDRCEWGLFDDDEPVAAEAPVTEITTTKRASSASTAATGEEVICQSVTTSEGKEPSSSSARASSAGEDGKGAPFDLAALGPRLGGNAPAGPAGSSADGAEQVWERVG